MGVIKINFLTSLPYKLGFGVLEHFPQGIVLYWVCDVLIVLDSNLYPVGENGISLGN